MISRSINNTTNSTINASNSKTNNKTLKSNLLSNNSKEKPNDLADLLSLKNKKITSAIVKIKNIENLNLHNAMLAVTKSELSKTIDHIIKNSDNNADIEEIDVKNHIIKANTVIKNINRTIHEINVKIDKDASFETPEEIEKPKKIDEQKIKDFQYDTSLFVNIASSNSTQKELLWLLR